MNIANHTINMCKRDYFMLPPEFRQMSDGPMVLSMVKGVQTFVRVNMLE